MLQFGHSSVAAHWRQKTAVANPRRFSRTMACSRSASRARSASTSAALRIDVGTRGRILGAHVDDLDGG